MNAIARGSFEVLSTLTASFRTAAFVEVLASWISGELAVSWLYVLIDTAQVLVAALLVRAWRRRSWRLS